MDSTLLVRVYRVGKYAEGLVRLAFPFPEPGRSHRTVWWLRESGRNSLASSIVPRLPPPPGRRAAWPRRSDVVRALKRELPGALKTCSAATSRRSIWPGGHRPGMAVFSRYSKVLEPSGEPMRVAHPLQRSTRCWRGANEQEGRVRPPTRAGPSPDTNSSAPRGAYAPRNPLQRQEHRCRQPGRAASCTHAPVRCACCVATR